jgi:hypothetical protein
VESKIGQLNESTRAALLASDLPAYLWPEVYMAMCHTQNIVPSSALQRELKKEKKEQLEKKVQKDGEEGSTPGEQGDAEAQAAAESLEVPVRDMIPYLAFHRGTSDEYFKQLVGQLKPWGVPVFVYHRRDNMRHLDTRSQKGFYMGPGSGPSMDRVFLKNGGTGTVKQFRHVLVPPAFAQQHAMRMHLAVEHYPPPLYEKGTHEDERMGTVFQVAVRDESEHAAYADEPFMEELAGLDMFDSIRAAPPDPKGEAVAVRGDNVPWDCGEHPALGHRHNDMSQTLYSHHVPPLPPGQKSPPPQLDSAVLISRHRHRDTPEVVKDIFNHVTDQAHAEVFGGPALWGRGIPKEDSYNKHGHVATHSCAAAVPGSTRHRDRSVVVFSHADDINVQDAIRVVRNLREAPRRSRFAKATRLLTNRTPVPQPTSDATGVAPHMRGMGGEKTSAMAEGTACERRPRRELDEGMGSGAGGDSRSQPDDRRDGYGQLLGPPPEVRVQAAPLRKTP